MVHLDVKGDLDDTRRTIHNLIVHPLARRQGAVITTVIFLCTLLLNNATNSQTEFCAGIGTKLLSKLTHQVCVLLLQSLSPLSMRTGWVNFSAISD